MDKITVLMTVYNGMPYLPQAIESILNQTWQNYTFLIIDDCSRDNSREVVLSYNDPRIRLLDNIENLKQTRSLNRGLENTRTELVARMDSDDISHPQRLERQAAYLKKHVEVAVVGTNFRWIDATGRITGKKTLPRHDLALRLAQLFRCPVAGGSVMFRRSIVWDQLGGFDPSITYSQDWELWSRVLAKYQMANLPEFLLDVRRHSVAISTTLYQDIAEENRIIYRASPQRILGIADQSEEWLNKIDTLSVIQVEQLKCMVYVVEVLFERFCKLFPAARYNTQVLKELTRQYMRIAYHNMRNFRSLFTIIHLICWNLLRHWAYAVFGSLVLNLDDRSVKDN